MSSTQHRVWKYGDNVNTDVIFPGKYTYTLTQASEMAKVALEDLDPTFAANVRAGDVVVGGRNWGNGSSREQAVTCLQALGVRAVIAASFARIYYRNAINSGLMVIECPAAIEHIQHGEHITLNFDASTLTCTAGTFSFPKLPPSVQGIMQAGGLIAYLKAAYQAE